MKEVMTSFDVATIVAELNGSILGANVNNLYQLNPKTLLLKLHRPDLKLVLELGRSIYATSYEVNPPDKPSSLVMSLRKYLREGYITKVEQTDFDRVAMLTVKTGENDYKIVLELFSKGNLIVIGPTGKIALASSYRRMRDRNILAGEEFRPAPSNSINFLKAQREDLKELRRYGDLEVVKGLAKLLGLGGLYSEEVLIRAGLEKNLACKSLTDEILKRIFEAAESIKSQLKTPDPIIVFEGENNPADVLPFPLKLYGDRKVLRFKTFNEAVDEYFTKLSREETVERGTEDAQKLVSEQERIKEQQLRQVEDLKKGISENQDLGKAIYNHFGEAQTLLNRVAGERRSGKEWNQIIEELSREKEKGLTPAAYFVKIAPGESYITLLLDDKEVRLDFTLSASENAAHYYESSKKAKSKMEGLLTAISETNKKIEERQARKKAAAEEAQKAVKERKKMWYEKFHWFRSSNWFLVVAGRDATSNEVLIKKYMEPTDLVLHTELPGAPFTVIKSEGREIDEGTIKEAAQFAASYGKSWREKFTEADIYWVKPNQVSKTPPSGEYIAKGMFMIRGDRNYLRHTPLGLAVGVKENGETMEVISGPPDAVKNETNLFVEIVPGERKSKDLAHKIRGQLAAKTSEQIRENILKMKLEEFQRLVPGGTGDIRKKP